MAGVRLSGRLVLISAVLAGLGLAGCGRSGPLELPPGPATPAPSAQFGPQNSAVPGSAQDAVAVRNGFDAQGNPVATPGAKKSFILDPLLQ